MYQCHSPRTRQVSLHRVLYRQFLVSYNLCTIYLHAIEASLKVTIAVFYFCHSKNPSNIMNNTLNSISIYSWTKKNLLTNIRNKCIIRKINLYFWRYEEWSHFSFKSLLFPIWSRISFLVEKWGTERARRYVSKNLLILDCKDSIRFGIYQVSYKWRII